MQPLDEIIEGRQLRSRYLEEPSEMLPSQSYRLPLDQVPVLVGTTAKPPVSWEISTIAQGLWRFACQS